MNRNIAVILSGRDAGLARTLGAAANELSLFQRRVEGMNTRAAKMASAFKLAFTAIAVAAAIGLGAAVFQAVKFEQAMRNVNTVMHATEPQFQAMSNSVLEMATRLPQSAQTLAQGLYDIGSSGFYGADALRILEVSAKAASAGLTDTATASRAIVGVLNAYGLEAEAASDVSDVLFKTVELGVVTFEELANQLGEVNAGAASAGIGIDEVGSAIATMTLSGLNAAESTTSLNRLIRAIIDPSDKLAKVLRAAGFESGEMALKQEGLYGVMQLVNDATGGSITSLQELFPEIRASRGAFALLANEGQTYARIQRTITDEQQRAGATQEAFSEQMKALGNQWRVFVNNIQVAGIRLGTVLIPAMVNGLEAARQFGRGLADLGQRAKPAFDAMSDAGRAVWRLLVEIARAVKPVVTALGALAAGAVIGGIIAVSRALEGVANFLADHKGLVMAVAAAYGATLVGRLLAAAAAFIRVQAGLIAVRLGLAGLAAQGSLLSRGGVLVGGVFLLTTALNALADAIGPETGADIDKLTTSLKAFAATGNVTGEAARFLGEDFGKLRDAWKELEDPGVADQIGHVTDEILSLGGAVAGSYTAVNRAKEVFNDLDEALARIAASDPHLAMRLLVDAADQAGISVAEMKDKLPDTVAQIDATKQAAAEADPAVRGLASSFEAAAADAELATSALEEYVEQLAATYDPIFGFIDALQENREAQVGLRTATDELNKARTSGDPAKIAEAERNYADAVNTARDSVVGLQSAAAVLTDAVQTQGLSVEAARTQFINMATAQGFTADEAAKLADQFGLTQGAVDLLNASDVQIDVTETGTSRVRGQLTGAQQDAINLGRQKPVVKASANTNEALVRIRTAKDRALDLGRQKPTVDLRARDLASGTIHAVLGLVRNFGGTVATATLRLQVIGLQEANRAAALRDAFRLGGLVKAQGGLAWQAGFAQSPTVLFGERATGGEAFIPRYGNPNRSRSILAKAADWYGMELRPRGMSTGGGRGDVVFQTPINVTVSAPAGIMAFGAKRQTVEEAISAGVQLGLQDHDKRMLRSLKCS